MDYYLFLLTILLIAITPGTDTVLVTKNTLVQGKRDGFKTIAGICTGLVIHILFAICGLSFIIANSFLLFEIIKYAGVSFLIFLGVTALLSKKPNVTADSTTLQKRSRNSCFFQGMFSNVLNPKAVIFFISFFPQFMIPGVSNLQMVILGVTPVLITLIWLTLYVYLINYLRFWFNKTSLHSVFQKLTGIMLISLGVKLAFEKR